MRRIVWAALLGAAVVATPAQAANVLWTFANVTFNDSGTLGGSFMFDADHAVYSDWNITTTTTPGLSGYLYTENSSSSATLNPSRFQFNRNDFSGYLSVGFTQPLTNYGGTFDVDLDSAEVGNSVRFVTGGSVSAPDAPGPLIGGGLLPALACAGSLTATRYRRRKAALA